MKIRLKKIFTLTAIMLLLKIGADCQNPLSFSLQEAKEYAMLNSYVIRNSNLDVNIARKKVWETIATGLPQVSGNASYTKFLNLPVSLIPAEFFGGEEGTYLPVKFGQDYNSDFGLTVDQLIFDGSYIVGVNSSTIYLQMAEQANEKTEIEVLHAVSQSYYLSLIANENLRVMKESYESSQKLLSDTKALYSNGFAEEQDVDQMQVMLKKGASQILKAERELRIAKTVLKYVMGLDITTEIQLTDNLEGFVNPLVQMKHETYGFDFTSHIDYKILGTQEIVSKKLLNLEKVAFLPRVNGFYSWSKTAYGNNANLYKSTVPWFRSSLIGLNISVPIFSSGKRLSRVKQAEFELEKVQNDKEQAVQKLQKDYLTAIADIENAVSQFENDSENKDLAKKILNTAAIKYKNGIMGSTELTQIESQYIQAHGTYVASMMQLLNAKVSLEKAIGKY